MRLELDRVIACLERLGHPERVPALRVQVAGTNGKGSTCAFVEAILRSAGLATGLYTSPHLLRLSERFRVGGEELSPGELLAADRAVTGAADSLALDLTFFERLTLMAAVAFAARRSTSRSTRSAWADGSTPPARSAPRSLRSPGSRSTTRSTSASGWRTSRARRPASSAPGRAR